MKKIIFLDILLIAIFIFALIGFGLILNICDLYWESYHLHMEELSNALESNVGDIEFYRYGAEQNLGKALQTTFTLIFSVLSAIAAFISFVLVNPQIFRKGRVDEIKQHIAEKRIENQSAKAQHEKERKQKRIEQLQAELDDLKKDGV